MKKNNRNLWIIILFFLCLAGSFLSYAEIIDKILVIVNDEVITQREVDLKMISIYWQYKTLYTDAEFQKKIDEAYKAIVESLINDKLIISEAKRRSIEITDQEVDRELLKVKSRFKSEDEFYLTLEQQGISVDELKENYRYTLMAKKLVFIEIGSKISIIPSEILEYYNNHKDEFSSPEMVKVRSILIKIKKDRGSEQSLGLARELHARLKDGDDFAEIAKMYSDDTHASSGGDMGYVKREEMIERIDRAIFNLGEMEFSDIIRTDLGFHIFKVEHRKEAQIKPFQEVRPQIERMLFEQKVQKRLEKYIKELRKNAYIAYK